MSDKGVGEKLVEMGVSSLKAGADEVKTGVSTAVGQITGQQAKSDEELQQISTHDKESSGQRIKEIQKELKQKRFNEVSNWHASATPENKDTHQEQQAIPRSAPNFSQNIRGNDTPLSVRQAVGNKEQGRNFKG